MICSKELLCRGFRGSVQPDAAKESIALFEVPEALRRRCASSGAPGGGALFVLNRGGPQITFSAMNIIQLYYTFQNVSFLQDCVNIFFFCKLRHFTELY